MLFDPRPKTKIGDLFDREKELNDLRNNLDVPIIVVSGIRRIGKSSIVSVFLNEIQSPSIVLDLRSLRNNYSLRDFYGILSKGISFNFDKLTEVIKNITAIKMFGNEVEIKWKGRDALTLSSFFDHINKKRIVIFWMNPRD